jgi:hypothetical protein
VRASANAVRNAASSAAHFALRSVTHGDVAARVAPRDFGSCGDPGSRGNDPPCSWRILRITSEASTIFSGTIGKREKVFPNRKFHLTDAASQHTVLVVAADVASNVVKGQILAI